MATPNFVQNVRIMKNISLTKSALSTMLAGAICLSGCSSLHSTLQPNNTQPTAPATVAYMDGYGGEEIIGYSAVSGTENNALTLTLPESYFGSPAATDGTGRLYIGGVNTAIHQSQILVYPPNSAGAVPPARTIDLTASYLTALAADPVGRVYTVTPGLGFIVSVYAATANGLATPVRSFELTNLKALYAIAADSSGNVYIGGTFDSSTSALAVYSPTANGPATPVRTITVAPSLYGMTIDASGNIFASVMSNDNCAIDEFGPNASGTAVPTNVINLPPQAGVGACGSVQIDGANDIFALMTVGEPATPSFVIYGFAPDASGNASPMTQIKVAVTAVQSSSFVLN
jgi:hypothetical protein